MTRTPFWMLPTLAAICGSAALAQPSFTLLGSLPGTQSSTASAISGDGEVVAGTCVGAGGVYRAFRWSSAAGMEDLGTLPGGTFAFAHATNADGSVVVGLGNTSDGYVRAFRWTPGGGMLDLGALPGDTNSYAYGVNADGSVVVGDSAGRAFRWTSATGIVDLGALPGHTESAAYGVSADGSVVVGDSHAPGTNSRAFRWTSAGGMEDLGTLGGYSWATAVSADGLAVTGRSGSALGTRAFRWTSAGGIQNLGVLPPATVSFALGISADGTLVVGGTDAPPRGGLNYAFLWTGSRGMVDLNTYLPTLGIDLGSTLYRATGVSADGSAIVGWGSHAGGVQAWLARLGSPCPGDLNGDGGVSLSDLTVLLAHFGAASGAAYADGDLSGDDGVDLEDLTILLAIFGTVCG